MKKNLQIYLLPVIYFIITISIALFSRENLPINPLNLPYIIGCLYSFFILKFLFEFETSTKPDGLEITMLIKLSVVWIILYYLAINVLPMIIWALLGGADSTLGTSMTGTIFVATILGTFLFLKILGKFDKLTKINKSLVSFVFAFLLSATSFLFNIKGSLVKKFSDGGNFVGGGFELTSNTIGIFLALIFVWQVAMTYYLQRKVERN